MTQRPKAMAPDLRRKVDENRRVREAFEESMKRQKNAQVGFTVKLVFIALLVS
jgi:hypothetical protein